MGIKWANRGWLLYPSFQNNLYLGAKIKSMKSFVTIIAFMVAVCFSARVSAGGNSQRGSVNNNNNAKALEGLLDSALLWNWDGTSSAYDALASGTFYTYNGNDRVTNALDDIYNSGTFKNYYQDNYTYNGSNYLTNDVRQNWSGSAWTNYQQYTYAYDGNNNRVNIIEQIWTSGAWANNTQNINHFNGSNLLINGIQQSWQSSAWVTTDSFVYTYDGNNSLLNYVDYTWSGTAWTNANQFIWTYNGNNQPTTYLIQTWNGASWASESEDYYTYNGSNELITDLQKVWISGVPDNSSNTNYTYDGSGNQVSETLAQYLGNAWVNQDSIHFYYTEVTAPTAVNNVVSNTEISVYPNPAKSVINVAYSNAGTTPTVATLYDVTGRVVMVKTITNSFSQINVNNLASGLYRIVFTDEQGNRTVKQVVIQ